MNKIEGTLDGKHLKVGIVHAKWNAFITDKLYDSALEVLLRHGVKESNIITAVCPGSFEIPVTAQWLLEKKLDGVLCLGAVIRGDTPHFEYVSLGVTRGIADVALTYRKPVIFGVLTTDTVEQALERAGEGMGNKGAEAAAVLLEMCSLNEKIGRIKN